MGGDRIMGASAGRVLLIPKGDWNADTTYTGLDWVRHNGAAWVCKNTCTNVEPTEENSDNWQIMSRDGTEITVDSEISDDSENPVQNKVIKKYVDEHTPEIADMTGATATQNGAHGLVPAPQIGDEKKALLGDGTWGSVDAIFTYRTKNEYDTAVANDEIPDGAKVIKEYDEGDSTTIIDVDTVMSDQSTNPLQNKIIKKYVDEKQVNIDGVTLTLDEARNVIKLADALKDKIGTALQPESIVNNLTTTEAGFALDARQANPNIDGSLAKKISDLNGSLNIVPINVVKTSSKAAYNSYEFFRIGHIGWYNMWLTYGSIQGADKFEEAMFKFPDDIAIRYITGGACSAYGETTHGGIDSIIYSTEHTLYVRAAGAINQTFVIYATGMFLIN